MTTPPDGPDVPVERDLLDPELHARGEAAEVLRELRETCPIAWRAGRRGPGYWAVTGYPELAAIARDPQAFTSYWGTRPEVRRAAGAARPLHNLDPPAHTEVRALANQLVAPSRFDALSRVVDGIIALAIDDFVAAGGGDAVPLAVAVPAQIFAVWMGLGIARAPELAACVDAVHAAGAALLDAPAVAAHRTAARDATLALSAMLRDAITAGAAPRASVLAELHQLVAGGALALDPATMLAALLVEAGLPTVIDAIAGGLALVRERPTDIRLAVEEILRLQSPIQQFARYAQRDLTIAGVDIRAGQQVVLWYGAANRDARAFPDADRFALRARNPHLAFGIGPHRCAGARMARDILTRFFTAWFARVPRHEALGVRRASSYMHGYRELLIRIT